MGDRKMGVASGLKQLNSVCRALCEKVQCYLKKIRYLPAGTQILYQILSRRLEILYGD